MEDVLPVCFQSSLTIAGTVLVVVGVFTSQLMIRPAGCAVGVVVVGWLVIELLPLVEMVPHVLKTHQPIVIDIDS